MLSLFRAPERIREGHPPAGFDASPPHPAVETAPHGGRSEATQMWVGAWTAVASGYGPAAANFL